MDKILLVSTPDLRGTLPISTIKEGLKIILTQAYITMMSALSQPSECGVAREQKGIKFCAHVWVQDISRPKHLQSDRKPRCWDSFKTVFQALVEMDSLIFLTTHWERISGDNSKEMEKIQDTLREDVRDDLTFARLGKMDQAVAMKRTQELFLEPEKTLRK
jgi:hypothetical protein